MATEHLAVPSLIARFNELYGTRLQDLGKPVLTEALFKEHFHGLAREGLCKALTAFYQYDIAFDLLYENREWRMLSLLQKNGVEMAAGVLETLQAFAQADFGLALVTNNPLQRALSAMRYATNGKGKELAACFGTDMFEAQNLQKPSPDVYLRAIDLLAADRGSSLCVEDSVTGVKAAVAAGLKCFGFTGFSHDKHALSHRLRENGAVACFDDWRHFGPAYIETDYVQRQMWTREEPASGVDLESLRKACGDSLPAGYYELLRLSDGGFGKLSMEPFWCDLFKIQEALEIEEDGQKALYPVLKQHARLNDLFVIGSSGDGELIAIKKTVGSIWRIAIDKRGGREPGAAVEIAQSFDDLMQQIFLSRQV